MNFPLFLFSRPFKFYFEKLSVISRRALSKSSVCTMQSSSSSAAKKSIKLFLCGDVMLGRGIDMIHSTHCDPKLYEDYMKNAHEYVWLAEARNGPITRPLTDKSYIWGEALDILKDEKPDVRIVNLETAITEHDVPYPFKGINYRLHPTNTDLLTVAKVDICVLANNHVLDWQEEGLTDTLTALGQKKILHAGAGVDIAQAWQPAMVQVDPNVRLVLFSVGEGTSGIPQDWAALPTRPGVALIDTSSRADFEKLARLIQESTRPSDIVVVSIHWGSNWGFYINHNHIDFAHRLVDEAHVDIVHGHSSHHVKGLELYHEKLILYGCGDFLNDYEGISPKFSHLCDDLGIMYFPEFSLPSKTFKTMRLIPTKLKNFRIHSLAHKIRLGYTDDVDCRWLLDSLHSYNDGIRDIRCEENCFVL